MPYMTSGNGTVNISVPAGSTLRVYSKSGTYTVTGSSVSVEDVTATQGCYAYGPQTSTSSIQISTTGELFYDVVAGDVTPDRPLAFNPTTGIPDPSGAAAVASAVAGMNNTILIFADSFVRAGDAPFAPSPVTTSGSISGVSILGHEYAAAQLTNSTSRTLSYNATTGAFSYGSGAPVVPSYSGPFLVPDASANTGVWISVRIPDLPATNTSMSVISSTNRPDVARTSLSVLNWFQIFDRQRHNVISFAGAGQTLKSQLSAALAAVPTTDHCATMVLLGINDVAQALSASDPLAEMKSRFLALISAATAMGKPCITSLISMTNATETTAWLELVDQYNRWLQAVCPTLLRVELVDCWASMINPDPAATTGRSGYVLGDDLHPLSAAAMYAGKQLANAVDRLGLRGVDPFLGYPRGLASATNPGGNLISNPWQNGSGGSTPSGVASTSWTVTNGAIALSALATSKVARTDGIAGDWLRVTCSSITDYAFFSATPTLIGGITPSAGDLVEVLAEVRVNGDAICADLRIGLNGWLGLSPYLRSCALDAQGVGTAPITDWAGVLRATLVWPSGATGIANHQFNGYLRNGASSVNIDIGRCAIRKIPS